jgi:hypothetical protein
MIRIVKKEDVAKYLDDPKREYIERRLGEMRQQARILRTLIAERPQRKAEIVSQIESFRVELEQAA